MPGAGPGQGVRDRYQLLLLDAEDTEVTLKHTRVGTAPSFAPCQLGTGSGCPLGLNGTGLRLMSGSSLAAKLWWEKSPRCDSLWEVHVSFGSRNKILSFIKKSLNHSCEQYLLSVPFSPVVSQALFAPACPCEGRGERTGQP